MLKMLREREGFYLLKKVQFTDLVDPRPPRSAVQWRDRERHRRVTRARPLRRGNNARIERRGKLGAAKEKKMTFGGAGEPCTDRKGRVPSMQAQTAPHETKKTIHSGGCKACRHSLSACKCGKLARLNWRAKHE